MQPTTELVLAGSVVPESLTDFNLKKFNSTAGTVAAGAYFQALVGAVVNPVNDYLTSGNTASRVNLSSPQFLNDSNSDFTVNPNDITVNRDISRSRIRVRAGGQWDNSNQFNGAAQLLINDTVVDLSLIHI